MSNSISLDDDHIDLSFIPKHLIKRMESKNVLSTYERILDRGRYKNTSMKGLQETIVVMKEKDYYQNEKASSKEFEEVVHRRSFDRFGHPLLTKKLPSICDEVLVSKSALMMKNEGNIET